jgi:hypothetical protein
MKWRVAKLGTDRASRELHKQIISRFQQIYRTVGEPEGVALYEAVDSAGQMHALCLNPAAVECCADLFEESYPWTEHDSLSMFNLGWVAGDRKLNNRL